MNATRRIVVSLIYASRLFDSSYPERALRKYRNFRLCNCDMLRYNNKKKNNNNTKISNISVKLFVYTIYVNRNDPKKNY